MFSIMDRQEKEMDIDMVDDDEIIRSQKIENEEREGSEVSGSYDSDTSRDINTLSFSSFLFFLLFIFSLTFRTISK